GIPRLGKSRNPRIPGVRTNSGIVGDAGRSFFGGHSTPRKKWIGVCHPVGLVSVRSRVARRRAFLVEGDPRMLTTSEASPAAPATEADFAAARSLDWSDYRARAVEEGRRFLGRVEDILDTVRAGREVSEAEGRVPDATVEAMIGTGLFRAFTPLRYGGLEMAPAAFFEGIMRIAEADSAAAWIAGQLNVHSFEIALMDERMQDEFWGENPDARASSSYAPIGKWEQIDGGYRLNGTWTFSSGVDHAQWVILGGSDRNFVVPIADVSIDHDSWDVHGLKGTGS